MAQVSIQYALHQALTTHEEKKIKKELDEFPGVKSVALNIKEGILCIDYDDTGVTRQELETRCNALGYPLTLIDAITF